MGSGCKEFCFSATKRLIVTGIVNIRLVKNRRVHAMRLIF